MRGLTRHLYVELKEAGTDDARVKLLLEVAHVAQHLAQWRPAAAFSSDDFESMVQAALAWRTHNELLLRRAPERWTSPADLDFPVSGVTLTPIIETAQLLAPHPFRETLVDPSLQAACVSGLEAWWCARCAFGLDGLEGAIGLRRDSLDSDWQPHRVLGAVQVRELFQHAGQRIMLQANAARRREAVRVLRDRADPNDLLDAARRALNALVSGFIGKPAPAEAVSPDSGSVAHDAGAPADLPRAKSVSDRSWAQWIRDGARVIIDTNAFLDPDFDHGLATIDHVVRPLRLPGHVLLHGAVLNEICKKRRNPDHQGRAAAALRLIESWQHAGVVSIPDLDDGGERGFRYADPHLLKLVRETAVRHPVVFVTRDRDLRIRSTAMAAGVRILSNQEWFARVGVNDAVAEAIPA